MSGLLEPFQFKSQRPGPKLLILGAVHGNETCGTVAIRRLMAQLSSRELLLERARLTLVPVTNKLAYERRQRASTATVAAGGGHGS